MISFYRFDPSWSTFRWFNVSGPCFKLSWGRRVTFLHLWTLFNRHTADNEHWWGMGFFQIGHRHLFYIGHGGISIVFIGRTD